MQCMCCTGKAVAGRDVVVFLSHSGGSMECIAAASHLVRRGVATLLITSNPGIHCAYSVVRIVSGVSVLTSFNFIFQTQS